MQIVLNFTFYHKNFMSIFRFANKKKKKLFLSTNTYKSHTSK